jgi:hypothetical protein
MAVFDLLKKVDAAIALRTSHLQKLPGIPSCNLRRIDHV